MFTAVCAPLAHADENTSRGSKELQLEAVRRFGLSVTTEVREVTRIVRGAWPRKSMRCCDVIIAIISRGLDIVCRKVFCTADI